MNKVDQNKLPLGWTVALLKDVCEILDNLRQPINSSERAERIKNKQLSELYPYYGATGQVGLIDDYITDGDYVLIGEDAAPFFDKSKDLAYEIKGKTWVNNHAHILKSFFNNRFLKYYLNMFDYDGFVSGTTRLKLTKGSLEKISVKVAPLNEQNRIVNKLDELLSELEKGKEQLQTALEQLKVYRQAILKHAFEGKLTNENIKEGTLPKGWKWVNLIDIVKKEKHSLKAGPFGSALKKDSYVSKGYKVYGQEQVISNNPFLGNYYINEAKYKQLESCKIQPFDILISLVGTIGKVLVLPSNCAKGIINPRLIKITLDQSKYLPKFFKYYFESSLVKERYSIQAKGTTMDVLNLGIIKKIPFPFTSLTEQQKLIEKVEYNYSLCDNLEISVHKALNDLNSLKKSVLQKAFEGKLVGQDPTDEPASLLLARIKKEWEEFLKAERERKNIKIKVAI